MGDFIWESVPGYTVSEQEPYGHGEKSVWIISSFLRLTRDEAYAIRWHMGFSEPKENYNAVGKAMEMCPLSLAVHEADLDASKLLEDTIGNKDAFADIVPFADDFLEENPAMNNEERKLDEIWPFDDDGCPFI